MPDRSNTIITWDQVVIGVLSQVAEPRSRDYCQGNILETIEKNWPQCAKNWFYAHGGSLDPDTSNLIFGQKIERATQRLARAREEADSGVLSPTERRMN